MPTPILLLKTKSSPNDGYEDFFSAQNYTPTFIPVLEHRFHKDNLTQVHNLFTSGAFTPNNEAHKYSGLIFTSQRAVEGFAHMLQEQDLSFDIPLVLYTVGPATARALTTLRDRHLPRATIHGAETGTGEKLAHFIRGHYAGGALLFLVGEVRRDIIPRTLMDGALEKRIGVDEVVVYETGVMGSFEGDFGDVVRRQTGAVWVVVFSPTGCEAMLRVLGLGPFAGADAGAGEREREREVYVATIGPTTRDYLREKFGFEAHVCAPRPSPEGILEGIERFMGA